MYCKQGLPPASAAAAALRAMSSESPPLQAPEPQAPGGKGKAMLIGAMAEGMAVMGPAAVVDGVGARRLHCRRQPRASRR